MRLFSANLGNVKVYITKKMRKNGGCVLAPYQITEGSLPRIRVGLTEGGVLVTSIELGGLVISGSTTLAEFSEAVIGNNREWEEGDQLSFFHGIQSIDAETGFPRADLRGYKVRLDTADPTPLWNIVTALGFTSISDSGGGSALGMSGVLTDGSVAWVHSREAENGKLKVSTQSFYVENSALAAYQTQSALMNSADSYGGINTKKVYLKPDGDTNSAGVSGSSSGSNSSSSSGGSGSGTGGSGSGTGGNGSDSGGGTGGSGDGNWV